MGTQGSFGYKIGKKIRLMHVQYDGDLLWKTCIRELFILLKHYGSIEELKKAFENLEEAKNKPTPEAIERCKYYTDLKVSNQTTEDWYCLTRNCQHSFINILDSGYFLNNGQKSGLVLLVDFNTNTITFSNSYKNEYSELKKATIDEIMKFDNMPTKSMDEILDQMKSRYNSFNEKTKNINEQIVKIQSIIKDNNSMDLNQETIQKAKSLLKSMEFENRMLELDYRYFFHRLDELGLITHSDLDNSNDK